MHIICMQRAVPSSSSSMANLVEMDDGGDPAGGLEGLDQAPPFFPKLACNYYSQSRSGRLFQFEFESSARASAVLSIVPRQL